ncbi:MAG: hypothetical protein RIB46_02035 [Pseudomonadales bacterium]
MDATDVVELYNAFNRSGVTVWIDGGWAVDAVVGRETRPHQDLDIAVEAKHAAMLKRCLEQHGYVGVNREVSSKWNFVFADAECRSVDVHVVVLHKRDGVHGSSLDGIAYPAGSLTGEGKIAGTTVRCVKAEFLLQFKTAYPPRDVDRQDVATLSAWLGCSVPESYRP